MPIELVQISKPTSDSVIAKSIANPLAWRNPDGIITLVKDGTETPLVWIEFSTLVSTMDHNLQPYNSFAAAGGGRIPVIKLYAARQSRTQHGGSQPFNPRLPFQILFAKYKTPGLELSWPVDESRRFAIRHAHFRACPPGDLGLVEVLEVCKKALDREMTPADALIEYAQSQTTPLAGELMKNMAVPGPPSPGPRATRFYSENDRWVLKFNRWDHGMDPERGMAQAYHDWVGAKLRGRLHDAVAVDGPTALKHFRRATAINVKDQIGQNRIDITTDILSSQPNRAGMVIASCCDEFTIGTRNGQDLVTLVWDVNYMSALPQTFEVSQQTILRKKSEITEDEVTFVLATRFFPANKFTVHSVSYPGAQGDFALLRGQGRRVSRKYFDIIAYKSLFNDYLVVLGEAKGVRRISDLQEDVQTVLEWRDSPKLRQLLLNEMQLPLNSTVLGAISYPGNEIVNVRKCDDLDFVVLVGEEKWSVWAPYGRTIKGLSEASGPVELPSRFTY